MRMTIRKLLTFFIVIGSIIVLDVAMFQDKLFESFSVPKESTAIKTIRLLPEDAVFESSLVDKQSPVFLFKHFLSKEQPRKLASKQKHDFVTITSSKSVILYSSAHYDDRLDAVKVVGFGPMSDNITQISQITCTVYSKATILSVSPLKVYYRISTRFPWDRQIYDSYIFLCPSNGSIIPTSVTIKGSETVTMILHSHLTASRTVRHKYQFAVCVAPIVNLFNDVDSLRHFVSANTFFGAEQFYFYNASVGPNVSALLHKLVNDGIATVQDWPLLELTHTTHAFGQKAAIAHCLISNRHSSKYLVFIDIDEVLVPRENAKWSSMLAQLQTSESQGAYVFQSKLFPISVSLCGSGNSSRLGHLWSLICTHSTELFPLYQWSKVLVRTDAADVIDIHMVRAMMPGFTVIDAPPSCGIIHHYRDYNDINLVPDDFMLKYQSQITEIYRLLF